MHGHRRFPGLRRRVEGARRRALADRRRRAGRRRRASPVPPRRGSRSRGEAARGGARRGSNGRRAHSVAAANPGHGQIRRARRLDVLHRRRLRTGHAAERGRPARGALPRRGREADRGFRLRSRRGLARLLPRGPGRDGARSRPRRRPLRRGERAPGGGRLRGRPGDPAPRGGRDMARSVQADRGRPPDSLPGGLGPAAVPRPEHSRGLPRGGDQGGAGHCARRAPSRRPRRVGQRGRPAARGGRLARRGRGKGGGGRRRGVRLRRQRGGRAGLLRQAARDRPDPPGAGPRRHPLGRNRQTVRALRRGARLRRRRLPVGRGDAAALFGLRGPRRPHPGGQADQAGLGRARDRASGGQETRNGGRRRGDGEEALAPRRGSRRRRVLAGPGPRRVDAPNGPPRRA